jgi:DNA-binding Lrp family transcriptional regulator
MATTESWLCKKHELHYSKASAAEKFYKCTVIENSKCPECDSLLRLERLSSGQYYLECTDESCSWNSYSKSPGLFFPTKEQLAREATKYNLIKGYKLNLCRRSLKRIIGKEICPNCFLEFLKRAPITNFSTIIESFKITAQQMIKLINQYIDEDRIYGKVDQKNQIFYYISYEIREKILSKIQDEGILKVADLAAMLDMSSEAAIKVIYKLISQFQIKGSFSQTKQFYYSQKYIMDHLVEEINQKGRISLQKLAKVFNIPVELTKSFCVNLMRLNTINGFFADRGNEIITSDKIYKEIKAYSKEVGLFELSNLAKKLKIAVELARKSLHELIKSGKIKGLFTQRREFMTRKYLESKIKEIARAYRTMPLRELSNRLGVTESSIEENLAQLIGNGDIDGYIDLGKRMFTAYSVPRSSAGSPRTKQKMTESINEAINNVKVILDAPSSYKLKQPLITVPVIENNNSRGVDFYLEPKQCGVSSIGGTVIYKDAQGNKHTLHIKKKEVAIKCPLVCTSMSTIEDCQTAIQTLGNDARAFLIADLDPRLAFRAAIRTLKNFDTSAVTSHEGSDAKGNYEAEAWFCSEAKVTGGRIITRVYVSEKSQSLEVRVWCGNPGQLTGFLAKVIELLFEQINIIRKIKSEERERTIDVMAITQNLAEVSDYCMLRWKAQNIRNKLHDTFVRLRKIIGDSEAILGRIEYWLTELNKYGKDDKISDDHADKLVNDVEKFRDVISRAIKL